MKIAVYTALYGEKDNLRPPLDYVEDTVIDYFVFTDMASINVAPYKTVTSAAKFLDIAKNARYFKIMGDKIMQGYDYVIWHDANIQLRYQGIYQLISKTGPTYLTIFTSPNRNDFYSEAMSCIRVNKDFSLRILKQVIIYFIHGMPAHSGMYATGILIRKKSFEDLNAMMFWWRQTLNYSRRDQLSLAYTEYKNKLNITCIEDDIFDNAYSVYHAHNYNYYKERNNLMRYNFGILKKLSFFSVLLLRKLKKL